MASYDYRCDDCDIKVTVTRSISESDPGYTCEKCGKSLMRIYTMSSPVFKGSGFYRTDK
jgi:putative FmdB family regulatory protein